MTTTETSPGNATASRPPIDAVVTHHRDGFRSGIARFNQLIAERLGAPLLGLDELGSAAPAAPLLSFKARELDGPAERAIEAWLERGPEWEIYVHEYTGLEIECRLVAGARRVHCGNELIREQVASLTTAAQTLWAPGLILDDRVFPQTDLSVFSFGMAHKIRTAMFRRLKSLLDATERRYAVYVSAATHETASLKDSAEVFEEMHELFPDSLYFLGNLSDVAVYNLLRTSTFFAAFFDSGVRANNTSVASAMEHGAIVITNLDEYSPSEFVHLENVIDIEQCERLPLDPAKLQRMRESATETSRGRGWDAFMKRLV